MASATFTADTTTIIPNPERGHYYSAQDNDLMTDPDGINTDTNLIFNGLSEGLTPSRLMNINQDLPQSGAISGTALTNMQTSFDHIRARGLKAILLFAYQCPPVGAGTEPALSVIQGHCQQIAPYLAANRDIIYAMKAGLIGPWGEWHTSPSGLDSITGKTSIKDAVLSMVPPDVPIVVRNTYPGQEVWFAGQPAISDSDAFSGSDKARIGQYIDCLLTGQGDSGSYPQQNSVIVGYTIQRSRFTQRQYVKQQTRYVPFGGETCVGSSGANAQMRTAGSGSIISVADGGAAPSGDPGGILAEGPAYNLSFLNRGYADEFWAAWTAEGTTINTVYRQLGYRFQYDDVSHSDSVARGAWLLVTINMRNVGWARVFSARRLMVRLANGGNVLTGYSSAQLRQLPAQATASTKVLVPVFIDAGAATGSWTVSLEMQDAYSTIASRREYKIRPANTNSGGQTWDDTNGRWATGTTVTVT